MSSIMIDSTFFNSAHINDFLSLGQDIIIATSVAIVVIAILRPLVNHFCGAIATLRLWWVLPLAILSALIPKVQQVVISEAATTSVVTMRTAIEVVASAATWSWQALFVVVWFIGVACYAGWLVVAQWRFEKAVAWRKRFGISPAGTSPAMLGILQPRLVLPRDFRQRYSRAERRLILQHERTHVERGDSITNLAMAVLTASQWWNPLVIFASRALSRDQERACDASVIHRHPNQLRTYADALSKTVCRTSSHLPLVCQWQSFHPTVERIAMLKRHRDRHARLNLAATIIACAAALASAIGYAARPATIQAVMPLSAKTEVTGTANTTATTAATVPSSKQALASASQPSKATFSASTTANPSASKNPQLIQTQVRAADATPVASAPTTNIRAAQPIDPTASYYQVNFALTKAGPDPAAAGQVWTKRVEFSTVIKQGSTFYGELPAGDVRLTVTVKPNDDAIRIEAIIESLSTQKVLAKPVLVTKSGSTGTVRIGKSSDNDLAGDLQIELTPTSLTGEEAAVVVAKAAEARAKREAGATPQPNGAS
jgi:beta-lactamase regulating signal transducer with metallopeptidase domain